MAGDVLQGWNIGESFKQRGKELGQGFLGEYGYQDYPTPKDYPPPPNYGYAPVLILHNTDVELFSIPPVQSSIVEGKWLGHVPTASIAAATWNSTC